MYTLLFLLPIYYRVVKQHSSTHTAILLLPQTASVLPCALLVDALIKRRYAVRRILLLGWVCTSCGVAMLILLKEDSSVPLDVVLNLLSGIGVSVVLAALHLSAEQNAGAAQSHALLLALRYLGSTLGLVAVGDIFRYMLRHNLEHTKFDSLATNWTQRSTSFVYGIRGLPDPADIEILIEVTQRSLRTTWLILACTCLAIVLVSFVTAMVHSVMH